MEGGRWNRNKRFIEEEKPFQFYDYLPIIVMTPIQKNNDLAAMEKVYDAPVYKSGRRQGNYTRAGHSTNFVMYIGLGCDLSYQHWINRGTAILCQLND